MEEGHLLLLDTRTQPWHGSEHWMLPQTSVAHIHLYFILSSFSPSFPLLGVEVGGWQAGQWSGWNWMLEVNLASPVAENLWGVITKVGANRMPGFLCLLSFAVSGGWECLVFHGESSQDTESLALKGRNGMVLLWLRRLSSMLGCSGPWVLLSY